MSDPKLRTLLSQLHAHLKHGSSLDDDARKHLTTALHDIEQALSRSPGKAAAPAKSRLEELAVKFEADHPTLAEAMRQLVNALGAAGI